MACADGFGLSRLDFNLSIRNDDEEVALFTKPD